MSNEEIFKTLVAAFKEMAPSKKPTVKEMNKKTQRVDISGNDLTEAWTQYQAELKQASDNGASRNEEIDGVFVRAAPGVGSFRRAGYRFDEAGMGFATGVFSEEELDALDEEKRLVVEFCTFTADDTFISE